MFATTALNVSSAVTWRGFAAALAVVCSVDAELAPADRVPLDKFERNGVIALSLAVLKTLHGLGCRLLGRCSTLLHAEPLLLFMLVIAPLQSACCGRKAKEQLVQVGWRVHAQRTADALTQRNANN
jgi:hypothetical protein